MFEALYPQIETIIGQKGLSADHKMQQICNLLQSNVPHYDWVGFYFADHRNKVLNLGAFTGEPTDHTAIPFGKGICGQVAVGNQNFVVPDVQAQDNYIACSLTVKSEIVIPIFKGERNIGQIDIDSNTLDPFTDADERFLEFVCAQVALVL
ncbi:MAG: GAF domain-containing protein [Flavobacteriaceae bacterium]